MKRAPNKALFVKTINAILTYPKLWDQGHWHDKRKDIGYHQFSTLTPRKQHMCGTSHCFAGWAEIEAGLWSRLYNRPTAKSRRKYPGWSVKHRATAELNIGEGFAEWLFSYTRTLNQLYATAKLVRRGEFDNGDLRSGGRALRSVIKRINEEAKATGVRRKLTLPKR